MTITPSTLYEKGVEAAKEAAHNHDAPLDISIKHRAEGKKSKSEFEDGPQKIGDTCEGGCAHARV